MKNKYQYEDGIQVYFYIPDNISVDEELPILFVLPGKPRNSASILADMLEIAERKRIILLSAKFDFEKYPPEMYNRGNVAIRSTIGHEYTIQENSSQFTFKKFIRIFNDFVRRFGLTNEKCDMYGFSAGAQALWTFLQFGSSEDLSFVNKVYPFSAGRYCYPSKDFSFPNGIKEFNGISDEDIKRFLGMNICMGVGLLDNEQEDRNLPDAHFDSAFGNGRLSRAKKFYNYCEKLSKDKNITFNWEYLEIPDIAHDNSTKHDSTGEIIKKGMARYFIEHIYSHSKNQLCITSEFISHDDYR